MHQIRLRLGLCPRPHSGTRSAPHPLAGFEGATSNGRGGRDRDESERGREGGEGKERRGYERRKGRVASS